MRADWKKKWIDALRSGDYDQARAALYHNSIDRSRISYCCNALEMANDSAMRFGLDLERKGVKLRKIRGRSQFPSKENP